MQGNKHFEGSEKEGHRTAQKQRTGDLYDLRKELSKRQLQYTGCEMKEISPLENEATKLWEKKNCTVLDRGDEDGTGW